MPAPKKKVTKTVREHGNIYFDGIAYSERKWLYSRKNGDRIKIVDVTYPFNHAEYTSWNISSDLRFSTSFQKMVEEFAKEGDIISKLLLKAMKWKVYTSLKMPNWISHREKEGMLSFTPIGKDLKTNDEGHWQRDGRQEMRPAALIRKILNPRLVKRLSDKHFNAFATRFKAAENNSSAELKFVSFTEAYDNNRYACNFGSCMADRPVEEFYTKFDCQALVAVRKDGKFVGRAIVWNDVMIAKVDENSHPLRCGKIRYMDRIYLCYPEYGQMFANYAEDNGILNRGTRSNSMGSITIRGRSASFDFGDEPFDNSRFLIQVKAKEEGSLKKVQFFPYLDTFRIGFGDCMYNFYGSNGNPLYQFEYSHTSGTRGTTAWMPGTIYAKDTGSYVPAEDCLYYRGENYYIKGRYVVKCPEDNKFYYYQDNRIIKTLEGVTLLKESKDKYTTCAYTNEYCLTENAVQVYRYNRMKNSTYGELVTVMKKYANIGSGFSPTEIKEVAKEYKFEIEKSRSKDGYDDFEYGSYSTKGKNEFFYSHLKETTDYLRSLIAETNLNNRDCFIDEVLND